MSGSTFGKVFRITTWGESHGRALGCVIDGCPAGLKLQEEDIQVYLNRRKPGQSKFTTSRKESDTVEILSGVYLGRTTGTPISLMVRNGDQASKDYNALKDIYRPGHADYTYEQKYGHRDHRGGGRSSGRETLARVAGGAVAALLLKELGIRLYTYAKAIGPITVPEEACFFSEIDINPLYMPNLDYAEKAIAYLKEMVKEKDSCGGLIQCKVEGLPVGLGEPVFDKLDASLAQGLMSIGAVKGVEIGAGTNVATALGSQNNDSFTVLDGRITKASNHAGGVIGGISDGDTLVVQAAIKPTPSIGQSQKTITKDLQEKNIEISGRHDPIIVPRAVVVVESMVALTLVDLLLQNMASQLDKIKKIYEK